MFILSPFQNALSEGWNPADSSPYVVTYNNNDRTMLMPSAFGSTRTSAVRAGKGRAFGTGKYYFEVVLDTALSGGGTVTNARLSVGVLNQDYALTNANPMRTSGVSRGSGLTIANTTGTGYQLDRNGNTFTAGGSQTWPAGTVIGVAVDLTAGAIAFTRNGVAVTNTTFTLSSKTFKPFGFENALSGEAQRSLTIALKSAQFAFTPPAGYSEWGVP